MGGWSGGNGGEGGRAGRAQSAVQVSNVEWKQPPRLCRLRCTLTSNIPTSRSFIHWLDRATQVMVSENIPVWRTSVGKVSTLMAAWEGVGGSSPWPSCFPEGWHARILPGLPWSCSDCLPVLLLPVTARVLHPGLKPGESACLLSERVRSLVFGSAHLLLPTRVQEAQRSKERPGPALPPHQPQAPLALHKQRHTHGGRLPALLFLQVPGVP